MEHMARSVGVDRQQVSAWGFSAGAYAVSECLARLPQAVLKNVVVGGLHGHGQPDLQGVAGRRRLSNGSTIIDKWNAYIIRLRGHPGVPGHFVCVHHPNAEICPMRYAKLIWHELEARQLELGCPALTIESPPGGTSKKKNRCHNYREWTFFRKEVLAKMFAAQQS